MNKRQIMKQQTRTLAVALALMIFAAASYGNSGKYSSSAAVNPIATAADDADLSTPGKAFAAYYQAVEDRDTDLFKKVASKRMLESMAAAAAKQQKKFDDEFVRAFLDKLASKIDKTPEIRNEKISGDTATLEEKLASGWREVACVKEDGAWKYDSFY